MFDIGTLVVDRREKCAARIAHVQRVPGSFDLLGRFIPSHRRYTVAYEVGDGVVNGEWHDNRMEHDLGPLDAAS